MDIKKLDVINYINSVVSAKELLKIYYNLEVHVGKNFVCPFHEDSDPSARLFADNKIFCHSEGMQYTPYKILLLNGNTHLKLVNKLIRANVDIKLPVDTNESQANFEDYFALQTDLNRLFIPVKDKLLAWHKFLKTK